MRLEHEPRLPVLALCTTAVPMNRPAPSGIPSGTLHPSRGDADRDVVRSVATVSVSPDNVISARGRARPGVHRSRVSETPAG